jgi:phage-related minor tail protein
MPSAKGNVFQSSDLHRYANTVVDKPTFFAFAKGAGVMGEAGPEAIMPLHRGPDGKLGVKAAAPASDNNVTISIVVNENGSTSESSSGDAKSSWTALSGRVKSLVIEEMAKQKRPGGILYT